ncbi:tRNA(Ile)-2-lysyl-cytidine synthase [Parastagonospora nodorum]|nr:tRNA(Ile)-2-lysyl-cytidine synthase [Parastagonospora nodorum]KAH4369398.1 tRNA(Ile)-2-lysyl-cytidine synthase [Parastagonospora nodorum]KAH4387087.1 tRNA(Ile)-2-lysyl-cytidine synthase [Parastagonospora nodorum]
MWRSNVLSLRQCSSAGRLRHGVNSRWYSSTSSLPITEKEFEDALEAVLPRRWAMRRGDSQKASSLGFAISGGVDSMALASIYARAQKADASLPQGHGFIVDHKVRPESTEEAAWVAEQLRSKFGMKSSILTLTWPENFDMSDFKRFETEARTRRYQALGQACRREDIRALMVAHHGDDQAETVLMRLANNRLRTGLKGMQSVEWIPECEGIYGVHHSGDYQEPKVTNKIPFPIEQGGIQILRPLLAMEKSRLIATCQEHGTEWAEDKSNHLRTLTSRNAIRHIYKAHELPKALSIPSLVALSLRMQERVNKHQAYARKLYDQCLMKLDIQMGTLLIRFPPFDALLGRPITTDADKNEAWNNAYCLIEKVADLVTANLKPALGNLAARVDSIYPEFLTPEEKTELIAAGESHFRDNFTVHHIWWRKCDKASPFEDHGLPSEDYNSTPPHPNEWLLTRQALQPSEARRLQLEIPPSKTSPNADFSRPKEEYQLFDGRFWIKLHNYTYDTLIIRTFEHTDMRHLASLQGYKGAVRSRRGSIPERFIAAAFALIKPSDVRFTLPAVFRRDATGDETLVGFPTLNIRMDGLGPAEGICDWHVRYKKIDFGQRSIEDTIVPGARKMDYVNQEKAQRYQNKRISRLKIRGNRVADYVSDAHRLAGYKRVYAKSGDDAMRERKKSLQYTQRAVQGEELEGLEFLRDDNEQDNEKR